jgi:hypothetical protein
MKLHFMYGVIALNTSLREKLDLITNFPFRYKSEIDATHCIIDIHISTMI